MIVKIETERRAMGWEEGVGGVKYAGFESKLAPELADTLKTSPVRGKRRDEGEDADEDFGRKQLPHLVNRRFSEYYQCVSSVYCGNAGELAYSGQFHTWTGMLVDQGLFSQWKHLLTTMPQSTKTTASCLLL